MLNPACYPVTKLTCFVLCNFRSVYRYKQERSQRASPPRGGEYFAYESKQYFAEERTVLGGDAYLAMWSDFAVTHTLATSYMTLKIQITS